MKSSVILLQSNKGLTESLAGSLRILFDEVFQPRSLAEVRSYPGARCATAVIVDLERVSLADVRDLARDLPDVRIICIHRLADEALWTAALNAGASDCCPSHDVRSIVNAARGLAAMAHSVAA